MTDKELIQAARVCQRTRGCGSCAQFNECPGRAAYLAMAADRLESLLAENERLKVQVPTWISVAERLPENEKDVLIAFVRKDWRGDAHRCVGMAFHTDGKNTTEDSSYTWEVGYIDMEYDEDTDAYIIPEGWWETVNFGETFSAVDMPVTHWMPIPSTEEAPHEDP